MSYGLFGFSGTIESSASSRRSAGSVESPRTARLGVVERHVGEQIAHRQQRALIVGRLQMAYARAHRMRIGAAQLLHRDLFVRGRLDDVGAGDEHVRGVAHHHDEVGHRGRVHRAAGARPHDAGNLRHHARGHHVAQEDVGVAGQRHHALLDARAARIVEPDHRASGLHRQVHHLADLLGERARKAAAENREILRENADLAPLDRAVAGDHAVARNAPLVHPEVVAAMGLELVELDEGAAVEQKFDALARGHAARLALAALPVLAAAQLRLARKLAHPFDIFLNAHRQIPPRQHDQSRASEHDMVCWRRRASGFGARLQRGRTVMRRRDGRIFAALARAYHNEATSSGKRRAQP